MALEVLQVQFLHRVELDFKVLEECDDVRVHMDDALVDQALEIDVAKDAQHL